MKIAIDFDGVILDSEPLLKFYADFWSTFSIGKERLRDDEVTQEKCFDWTGEEIVDFYNQYFDKITRQSHLMVGAKEILQKLKDEGHQLYIVTLRGYYNQEERIEAEEKLNQLGIEFDQICWGVKDKIGKCKELEADVMIDDNPTNVMQFANENIKVLYFKEAAIREIDLPNVKKVGSWMDIYRQIKLILKEEQHLLDTYDLHTQIEKADQRKVWLKSGGFIIIDRTEALTSIDVNSGKYTGKKDLEQTILKVNLEASIEIAKQLKLKDIGGIVIIDYIDMFKEEDKQKIIDTLQEELKKDRSKTQILGFTKLNLLEMTRKHIIGND